MNKLIVIPPPLYAAVVLGLCYGLDRLAPLSIDLSLPWLGAVLLMLAGSLMGWALWQFRLQHTTPIPVGTPSALVTSGPYRWTRNPMYLGILLVLLSAPLFAGSIWYLLAAPAFWAVVNALFVPYEEAKLEALFGDQFRAFAGKVRRWI
jgi:protein-S-isoprenylcysteine O-methyltransferase Ste14